jgi:hypothetical protein
MPKRPRTATKHGLAGSTLSNPANDDHLSAIRKANRLAQAAGSPGSAAATTAAAAAASPATTATAAATTTAATTAAAPSQLNAALGGRCVLFVEDIECRQADIGDFFFTEGNLMT